MRCCIIFAPVTSSAPQFYIRNRVSCSLAGLGYHVLFPHTLSVTVDRPISAPSRLGVSIFRGSSTWRSLKLRKGYSLSTEYWVTATLPCPRRVLRSGLGTLNLSVFRLILWLLSYFELCNAELRTSICISHITRLHRSIAQEQSWSRNINHDARSLQNTTASHRNFGYLWSLLCHWLGRRKGIPVYYMEWLVSTLLPGYCVII